MPISRAAALTPSAGPIFDAAQALGLVGPATAFYLEGAADGPWRVRFFLGEPAAPHGVADVAVISLAPSGEYTLEGDIGSAVSAPSIAAADPLPPGDARGYVRARVRDPAGVVRWGVAREGDLYRVAALDAAGAELAAWTIPTTHPDKVVRVAVR
jgi:hypothetical protein